MSLSFYFTCFCFICTIHSPEVQGSTDAASKISLRINKSILIKKNKNLWPKSQTIYGLKLVEILFIVLTELFSTLFSWPSTLNCNALASKRMHKEPQRGLFLLGSDRLRVRLQVAALAQGHCSSFILPVWRSNLQPTSYCCTTRWLVLEPHA